MLISFFESSFFSLVRELNSFNECSDKFLKFRIGQSLFENLTCSLKTEKSIMVPYY